MHESSKEFEIRPDLTTDCGVSCPLASDKIPIDLGKSDVSTFSQLFLIKSFSYLQLGNVGIHKSLDEFEIRPDPIRDHRVSCP